MVKKRLTYHIVPGDLICSFDVSSWERLLRRGTQVLKSDKNLKILGTNLVQPCSVKSYICDFPSRSQNKYSCVRENYSML